MSDAEFEIDEGSAACRLLFHIDAAQNLSPLPALAPLAGIILAKDVATPTDWQQQAASALGVCLSACAPATDHHPFDGCLLERIDQIDDHRRRFGDDFLIGYKPGLSRHEAMLAGEAGADYVLVGETNRALDEQVIDFVVWWSDVTVLPIAVACAVDDPRIADLVDAGAGFVVLPLAEFGQNERSRIVELLS